MTENEENRVHFLLDRCDENGSVTIKKEDMELILKHQRELGIEEGKKAMEEILQEQFTQSKNEIYLQGRTDQKHEDLDAQVILTKHEIEVLQISLIKKILAVIESEYDLDLEKCY